jgi:hypothetical protein
MGDYEPLHAKVNIYPSAASREAEMPNLITCRRFIRRLRRDSELPPANGKAEATTTVSSVTTRLSLSEFCKYMR